MKTVLLAIAITLLATAPADAAQWSLLSPAGGPAPGRTQHTAIFDAPTRRMVIHGGASEFVRGDTWRLTNADGIGPSAWTQVIAAGTAPPPLVGHSAVYDSAGDSMVVFAGGGCRNDTYLLTNPFGKGPGATEWKAIAPQSPPPARFMHSAVIDTTSRRMIVFGGENGCPLSVRNDVWVLSDLDTNAPKWTQLFPSGSPPAPRFGHSAMYDPASNRMIIFGGANHDPGGFMNDVWVLSNANGLGGTPVWTKLNPAGTSPAPRDCISAVYDPITDEMTIVGGLGSTFFDDVWVLRNTRSAPSWVQLPIQGPTPGAPTCYSLVYSPTSRTTTLYGGIPGLGGGYSSSTWTLSTGSPAAETMTFANFDSNYVLGNSGWRVGGGAVDGGGGTTIGMLIVPAATGTLTRLELAVSKEAGAGKLNANLMSDVSGAPGAVIESFSIAVTSANPTIVTASSSARPLLFSGQRYWLVLTTPDLINDSIFWHRQANQPFTTVAYRNGTSPTFNVYAAYGGMARLFAEQVSGGPAAVLLSPANLSTGMASTPTLSWSPAPGATSYDVYFGTTNPPPLQASTATLSFVPGILPPNLTYYWGVVARSASGNAASPVWQFTTGAGAVTSGLSFIPVAPCRVVDTRLPDGPFGGPYLGAASTRQFNLSSNPACAIPGSARAYALNVTVVPRGPLGYITLWPSGQAQPLVSTLNSLDGRIKANAAIVPAGGDGGVQVYASGATDAVLDINGYFLPATDPAGLAFYPVAPCRVFDTRLAMGALGGPGLAGGESRSFPLVAGTCGTPGSALAYSLNFTVVPTGPLGYLTTWPSGGAMPVVSTLNAPTGTVTANAAIVPAGTNGAISVFASASTQVIADINGYFAAPGTGGLSFYPVSPCRVADTRAPVGPLGGPMPWGQRDLPVSTSGCGLPATAKAYSFNVTVVPRGPLGYLTIWPAGQTMPVVSTLNSLDATIVANAAIVPTLDGSISVYLSAGSDVVLDANGYFAP